MTQFNIHRLLRAESLTAVGVFIIAAGFLVPTARLQPISALLPAAMLISLMVLSVLLLIADQRKAGAGVPADRMTKAPQRVFAAFGLVVLYALAVDLIGFYPSTALSVPLVAYAFGYRDIKGLALATVIVLAVIYLIFSLGMSQEFPDGRLWSRG